MERDPFLVSGWRLLGEVLERGGREEEAIEVFRQGLRRRVDDQELHAQIGVLLARGHAESEAEVHLREAIRLARRPQPEVRAPGRWSAEHSRFEEALAEYEKVLQAHPRHPGARNDRAIAYFQTGRLEEAGQELVELVREFPRHADAHNNLAVMALGRGRYSEAERWSRRTLELQPEMAEAWNNLGLALSGRGQELEARQAWERALELQPGYWQARLNLGLALSRLGEWQPAATTLEAVIRQVPGRAEAHLELGRLFAGPLHDAARARAHYNAFLRQAPDDPETAAVRRELEELDL